MLSQPPFREGAHGTGAPFSRGAARQPRGAPPRALQTRVRTHTRRRVHRPRPTQSREGRRGGHLLTVFTPAQPAAGPFALKSTGGSRVVARGQARDVGHREGPSGLYSRRWHVPERRLHCGLVSASGRRRPPPAVAPGRSSSVGKPWPGHGDCPLPAAWALPLQTRHLPCTRVEDPVRCAARRERGRKVCARAHVVLAAVDAPPQ